MWRKALVIGVAILAFSIYAQEWGIGVQPDFGVRVEAICFLDDGLTGWATGYNHITAETMPVILHTTDGGATGTRLLNIPETAANDMYGIFFLDANKGWAVGEKGVILYTEDGGTSWVEQTSGVTKKLTDVFFVDDTTGWIIGDDGTILNTIDGGTSWNAQTSGTGEDLYAIAVYDALHLWISGSGGTILYTTDGGTTWTASADVPVAGRKLYDIDFVDTLKGWAVGQGFAVTAEPSYIVKTEDGGITWTLLTQTDPTYVNLYEVVMLSETEGYIAGDDGTILKTTDGDNFNIIPQTTTINMFKDLAVVSGKIWAAGEYNCLIFSEDETNWEYLIRLLAPSLYGVNFFAHDNIWMVGWDGMVTIYDGNEWFSKTLFTTDGNSNTLRGIDVVDENTAWVVGYDGFAAKTTDGGNSWEYQESGVTESLYGIFALNAGKAWAWGATGTLIRSDDGVTWTALTTPVSTSLYGGFFFDENNGWIVGKDGLKAKTTDGGDSLIDLTDTLLTDENLNAILFVSSSKGWIAGDNGTILYTENGGDSWTTQESGLTTEDLYAIEFINETTGWIVGSKGVILYTTDAGTNWTRVGEGLLSGTIRDVTFFADDYGLACGVYGTGLQYGEYGIEEIPYRNSSLSVYPNPVKGTARIRFTLSSPQKVRVDIYNIVGQRIRAIEGDYSSGDNVLIWDGKDESGKFLPRGVYLYRVNSPDLRETGKFVFLR